MNPFKLQPEKRLTAWEDFRDTLPSFSEADQIAKVAEFWAQCPFERWTIEPENPISWPSIWEMIFDGEYCMNAVAIGIESTLRLSGWNPARLELIMMKEVDTFSSEYFIVKIDGNHVLNYSYGHSVLIDEIKPKIEFMYGYQWVGNGYKRYK